MVLSNLNDWWWRVQFRAWLFWYTHFIRPKQTLEEQLEEMGVLGAIDSRELES